MMLDGPRVMALMGVFANAVPPAVEAVDLATRGGPVALLVIALLWLERERKLDRARCDKDHGERDRHIAELRKDLDTVRVEGDRRHAECRAELRATTDRLIAMIDAR